MTVATVTTVTKKVETLKAPKERQEAAMFLQGRSVDRVLGMVWDSSRDTFSFKVTPDLLDCQKLIQLSKRKVWSQIAHLQN